MTDTLFQMVNKTQPWKRRVLPLVIQGLNGEEILKIPIVILPRQDLCSSSYLVTPLFPIQVCKVMVTNPLIPVLHPPGGGGVEEVVAKNRATGTLHNLHRRNNTQSRRCMYTVQT